MSNNAPSKDDVLKSFGQRANDVLSECSSVSREQHVKHFLPRCAHVDPETVIENISLYRNVSNAKGPLFTYSISWTSASRKTEKAWLKATAVAPVDDVRTPPPSILCDGPCASVVPLTNIVQFGDCDHNICRACLTSHKSVPTFDGSPGCCNGECVGLASLQGKLLRGAISSSSTLSVNHPFCETILIYVSVLEKMRHNTIRKQHEFELASSDRVSILRQLLCKHEDVLREANIYCSSRRPKCKADMIQLSLDTHYRFSDIVADNTTLYIVVAGKGVRL